MNVIKNTFQNTVNGLSFQEIKIYGFENQINNVLLDSQALTLANIDFKEKVTIH